ncbi:glycosyl transferase [Flavobacterium sp. IR1]|nr:glycosyl transferase [Flavobacterium sp. IR1]
MVSVAKRFTILITTKDRREDLVFTLSKIQFLLDEGVNCIICDDASIDGTFDFIKNNFPKIQLIQNKKSEGLIYSRNRLMELVTTEFAISIDDDLHFVTKNPLEIIEKVFYENPKAGLCSFRIFWNLNEPEETETREILHQMQSFAGGANVWRMTAWKDIPDYPAWFVFYGEEDFASYQLFKKKWKIYYLPEVLVNHRVNLKARKKGSDYSLRLQRSLRSGWYLYFMFYPLRLVPKKMAYSIWMQLKLKVFKGDLKAFKAIIFALFNVFFSIPKIIKNANRLSLGEYHEYQKLERTKLYWQPEDK